MKTTALIFAIPLIAASALLTSSAGTAQPAHPAHAGDEQSSARSAAESGLPSSNAWDSLPQMSVYRCLAEAIGTASDPMTGAPVGASTDPQSGRLLCPNSQPEVAANPTR